MEYVEGESLPRALRRGPLEPRARRARCARPRRGARPRARPRASSTATSSRPTCCCATTATVKLADLGIATAVDQTRITRSGTVLGHARPTWRPSSSRARSAGPATDVYALAAVCFEALAGRKARDGRTPVEIAHAIATDAAARPARAGAGGCRRRRAGRSRAGWRATRPSGPPSAGELAAELAPRARARAGGPTARRSRADARCRAAASRPAAGSGVRRSVARGRVAMRGPDRAGAAARGDRGRPAGGRRRTGDKPRGATRLSAPAAGRRRRRGGPARPETAGRRRRTRRRRDTAPAEPEPAPAPADPGTMAIQPRGAAAQRAGLRAHAARATTPGACRSCSRRSRPGPSESTDIDYAYALYNLGQGAQPQRQRRRGDPLSREAPQLVQPARHRQAGAEASRARTPDRGSLPGGMARLELIPTDEEREIRAAVRGICAPSRTTTRAPSTLPASRRPSCGTRSPRRATSASTCPRSGAAAGSGCPAWPRSARRSRPPASRCC